MGVKLTVSQGGTDIEPGAYSVVLAKIEGPKTIDTQDGPKEILEWTFAIMDGDYADTEIRDSTSLATSPRSKMYGWLAALNNGRAPEIGANFDTDELLGRMAIATIEISDRGWPKVKTLSAMPGQAQAALFSNRMGLPQQPQRQAPSRQTAAPARAQAPRAAQASRATAVAEPEDDLPF